MKYNRSVTTKAKNTKQKWDDLIVDLLVNQDYDNDHTPKYWKIDTKETKENKTDENNNKTENIKFH